MFGILVFSTGCMGAGGSKTEKEIIALKDTTLISVEGSSVDIEIIPEDREDISVVLHTYERGPRLKVSSGKTVHIEAKSPRAFNISFSMNYAPRLTIYVPEDYAKDLEIDSSSGDLEIKELNLEELNMELSSGDIQIRKVTFNEGSIESSSGDITLDDVTCDKVNVHSSSGDLKIDDFTGELEGNTSSGDVRIAYKEFNNNLDYSTQSGDITVDFNNNPVDAAFDLDCSSGDVSMNFDLDETDREKENQVKGTNGEGTYDVKIHASSGDITVNE